MRDNVSSSSHRLVRALLCQEVDRTPVWMMRQAGRYLPEYRELRKKAGDFLTLCKTPELACEITLQPLQRFPLDAAIIFSDILTIPDAYGLGLHFLPGEGPCFKNPVRTLKEINLLPHIDPEIELGYVMEAIRMTKKSLHGKVPLIGFAGSPWTIATYMVEGSSSKHFNIIKRLRYEEPDALHQLLSHLSKSITDYLMAQISAGADVIMLFDTWGGVLNEPDYLTFSLFYMSNIIQNVKDKIKSQQNKKDLNHPHPQTEIPIIVFTKNGGKYLEAIADSGCDAIGLDWTANLKNALDTVKPNIALQGNLDPAILYAKPDMIIEAVKNNLEMLHKRPGFVFNLGHGVPQDASIEAVSLMIEAVHRYSQPYHQQKE